MSAFDHEHEQRPQSQFDIIQLVLKNTEVALELGLQAEARAEEQTALAQKMQELAELDGLTGLQNRRALENSYTGLQTKDTRRRHRGGSNQPVALLMADIDHFKSINDGPGGHAAGDDVLKGVANVMRQSVRQRDVVSRWGGEEFALLLPRASRKTALRVAESIRENVAAGAFIPGAGHTQPVTLSMGVAMVNLHEPLEMSMAKADLALYAAKHQGRDQVVFASQLPKIPKLREVELIQE
jgi:diguanylate cyclase (GGDEF)-like protein